MNATVRDARPRDPDGGEHPGAGTESVRAGKRRLRAAITRDRGRRSQAEQSAAARGVREQFLDAPRLRDAHCVGVYVPRPGEPGTHLLREALAARGVLLVRPALGATAFRWMMTSPDVARRGCGLTSGRPRLPARPVDDARVQVVLVPALAVDTCGRRLGHGCDGYDEILRRLEPTTLVVAIIHDDELLDCAVESVPEEPHDVRVDAALTPSKIRYFAGR